MLGMTFACASFFYILISTKNISMSLINGGQFRQTVCNVVIWGVLANLKIADPSVLNVYMLLHSTAMTDEAINAKALMCSSSHLTKTLIGFNVKKISKTWMAFAEAANFALLVNLVSHKILFASQIKQFFVLRNPRKRIWISWAVALSTALQKSHPKRGWSGQCGLKRP